MNKYKFNQFIDQMLSMVASEASKHLEEDLYQMLLDGDVYTAVDGVLKCQESVGEDGDIVFN